MTIQHVIQEIHEREWLERHGVEEPSAERKREGLFFFTSMCGTCKLAEKMLEIAVSSGPVIPVSKININYSPVLRDRWEITSVPCLVVLENGKPVQIEYAMRSVVDMYTWLKLG
ncbi:Thioredoxin [compost metagenome]